MITNNGVSIFGKYVTEFDIKRYEELRELFIHPQYILDEEEFAEYNEMCSELLHRLIKNNSNILQTLLK